MPYGDNLLPNEGLRIQNMVRSECVASFQDMDIPVVVLVAKEGLPLVHRIPGEPHLCPSTRWVAREPGIPLRRNTAEHSPVQGRVEIPWGLHTLILPFLGLVVVLREQV